MKPIIQYKNGIPLKSYKTISEIQRKKGYLKSHISECLNGKRKTAYGYEWRYQTKIKGRLRYYFKNKNEIIKDVGFLSDKCEQYEQENKMLKEHLKSYKKDGDKTQDRIEKAIEYCENNKEYTPRLIDVIDILKGSDENGN